MHVLRGCCNDVLTIEAIHEFGRDRGELFYFADAALDVKVRIKVDWNENEGTPG